MSIAMMIAVGSLLLRLRWPNPAACRDDLMSSADHDDWRLPVITDSETEGVEALVLPCWPFCVSAACQINHRAHLEPDYDQQRINLAGGGAGSPQPSAASALRRPPARANVGSAASPSGTLLRGARSSPGLRL